MGENKAKGVMSGTVAAIALLALTVPACQDHKFQSVEPRAIRASNTTIEVIGKQAPPNIMLVVDRSGSMTESVTGTGMACTVDGTINSAYDPRSPNPCKWNDLKDAFANPTDGFLVQNQGLARFGLLPYPASSGTCDPGKIAVPVEDDVQPIRDQLLNRVVPGGGTPSAASLLEAASDPAIANQSADRQRFAMLLTDGLPNCNSANQPKCAQCRTNSSACSNSDGCRPTDPPLDSCGTQPFDGASCLDEEALVDAVTNLRSKNIITFVIGFGKETAQGDANRVLDRAAEAGGHPRAGAATKYYQATTVEELKAFLQEILKAFPCTYPLSPPPNNSELVTVSVTDQSRSSQSTLQKDRDWSFTSPAMNELTIQGDWCARIQNAPMNRYLVHINYANPM